MSIRKAFLREEILRKRKRLGWLAWLTIMVSATFLLAFGVLVWRTMTQQPQPIGSGGAAETSTSLPSGITQGHAFVPAIDLVNSPTLAPKEPPRLWIVWKTQDPIGQDIWDAAPEVKAWVIRDYLNALAWTDEYMFEPQYLLQNLERYYSGKRLAEMRAILEWEQKNQKVIAISAIKRLPLGTLVGTFSPDGKSATVLDYHAAGRGQVFDLQTRKPLQGEKYPNTMHMIEMRYDDSMQRWTISRARMDYDLDTGSMLWREEWDRAQ